MKTSVITINPDAPEKEKVERAGYIIREGGIVAFPTDTVYGLGVDVFNEQAVRKLYRVKERSRQRPASILIKEGSELDDLVLEVPDAAKVLMEAFWPGALTIVFRASGKIGSALTAGSGTIGIRIPENRIAISLIEISNVPITGSSANISGNAAASCKEEVLEQLEGKIDMVIDGGASNSRVPSTVVDLSDGKLNILREGKIPKAVLETPKAM